MHGVETRVIDGVQVQLTAPAKTVADCFRFRCHVGLELAPAAPNIGTGAGSSTQARGAVTTSPSSDQPALSCVAVVGQPARWPTARSTTVNRHQQHAASTAKRRCLVRERRHGTRERSRVEVRSPARAPGLDCCRSRWGKLGDLAGHPFAVGAHLVQTLDALGLAAHGQVGITSLLIDRSVARRVFHAPSLRTSREPRSPPSRLRVARTSRAQPPLERTPQQIPACPSQSPLCR